MRLHFKEVFVQPAAGDAGLAIGAAYYIWHQKLGKPRSFAMGNSYWGPEFSRDEIRKAIDASAIANNGFCVSESNEDDVCKRAAAVSRRRKNSRLVSGTRRMGPARTRQSQHRRRSAAARHERHSESPHQASRNFSPICAIDSGGVDRRMVREIASIAIHDDGLRCSTGKTRTDSRAYARRWHRPIANGDTRGESALLATHRAFEQATGVPIVLNTSFNDNEPIVCRPEEALDCFQRTQMDALALGDFFITKK